MSAPAGNRRSPRQYFGTTGIRIMTSAQYQLLTGKLRHIANESAEFPGIRLLARPLYRKMFARPQSVGNYYYGRYESYDQARADAPETLPSSYDTDATAILYHDRHKRAHASDYPLFFWLSRLLESGSRTIFDLGGHIGVSYYGLDHYIDYPRDMQWLVHDTPAAIVAGRQWADRHDPRRQLRFTGNPEDADGHDVLISNGALQYLDYSLPELLTRLRRPPTDIVINLTPFHPDSGYFTLQNMGIAICPYRVMAITDFVAGMQDAGYRVMDQWRMPERSIRIPFEPSCRIDCYYGLRLRRNAH
jgi:putative methyltransferase (TIGR04325 family)